MYDIPSGDSRGHVAPESVQGQMKLDWSPDHWGLSTFFFSPSNLPSSPASISASFQYASHLWLSLILSFTPHMSFTTTFFSMRPVQCPPDSGKGQSTLVPRGVFFPTLITGLY